MIKLVLLLSLTEELITKCIYVWSNICNNTCIAYEKNANFPNDTLVSYLHL